MSVTGQGSISYRRADVGNEKNASVGFSKTIFAHKASAGATGINLTALTIPTEMSANGFSNPTTATLQGANLLFYPRNLKLVSTSRPSELIQFLTWNITSSSQITFLNGFTALEGEIFIGTIDYNQTNGVRVVDARAISATGTIAATATDFNVGTPFTINQNSGSQVGAVLVYVDGVLQARNTGNSSSVLDGNYYEVPVVGSNLATTIRMNVAHPTAVRNVVVVSNGLLMERPDGSMIATIETINGSVQNMATYLAAATGQSVTTVLGAAVSGVDQKAFGDRVVALETRANVDETPTLQTDIIATRLGQKFYSHGTTYNGGNAPTITLTGGGGSLSSVGQGDFVPYQMQDGTWRARFNISVTLSTATRTFARIAVAGITFYNVTPSQAISGYPDGASPPSEVLTDANAGTMLMAYSSATTSTHQFSGDVRLASKPTWAY